MEFEALTLGRHGHWRIEPVDDLGQEFLPQVDDDKIRFRPILMTTLTTDCGMLPLAIGLGEGSELMRPLAIAVMGKHFRAGRPFQAKL